MRPSERILAMRALPELRARLDADLRAAGVDPRDAERVVDDRLDAEAEIPETGYAIVVLMRYLVLALLRGLSQA